MSLGQTQVPPAPSRRRLPQTVARRAWDRLAKRYETAARVRAEAWRLARAAQERIDAEAPLPPELRVTKVLAGREVETVLEDPQAIRARVPDPAAAERLTARLAAWRAARAEAARRHRADTLTATAERASAAAEALRDQLLAAPAPDLEAVARKLRLLPKVTDGVWDFTDPETLAEAMLRRPGSEATCAVAHVYLDVLTLAGSADEAEALLAAARRAPS